MPTERDLCQAALTELGIPNAVGDAPSEDEALAHTKFVRLLNSWNAERHAVYTDVFSTFTLTPSLQPHTIGSSGGTFTVASRPEEIQAANLIISGVKHPIGVIDVYARNRISTPTLTGAQPTSLYYEKAWPLGKIWLYPIPSSAQTLELLTRVLLVPGADLNTDFSLPPGYEEAIVLSLAESCAPAFLVPISPDLEKRARKARARVFSNNTVIPALDTRDARRGGGTWNYLSGRIE